MAITRRTRFAAGAAVAALALAGCAAQTEEEPGTEGDGGGGGTIRVAETNAFTSFNSNQVDHTLDVNGKVTYMMRADWQYIANDLSLVKDESFGTFERTSEDPLTVEYNINDDVVWSDGNKIDKADMLLQWAVLSGHFDNAKKKVAYFLQGGENAGLSLTDVPEFSDANSMSLVYSKSYVDWEIGFEMLTSMPAHVVAERAGMTEEELVELLETAEPGVENEQLRAVADVWNKDFNIKALGDDPSLYLSSGPMIATDAVEDQSITLGVNEEYAGDLAPQVDEITVRFIGDAAAQVAALRNGEVDIIAPQPNTDTVEQINALQDVTVHEGSQLSYDHVDLSFDSDVFSDADVRKAFLLTIPREDILDRLIRPMYADAVPVNSQIFLPSQGERYDAAVEVNGSDAFAEVDIDMAKELLDGRTPTVRLLYNNTNPIRVDSFQMIQESASKAGFTVEDGGDPKWSEKLGDGTYDASLFGWINSGVGFGGVPQLFSSTGGGNFSAYSNDEVDQLSDDLMVELDADAADEIQREIDTLLFADSFGLPLFQTPGIDAHSNAVSGVEFNPNKFGVWWNFWEWTIE